LINVFTKKIIKEYLEKNKYGNAVQDDLWDSLNEVILNMFILFGNKIETTN